MSSKIKFVFGASVLGILGIFTFKIFFTSNDEYLFENKHDESTQQVINSALDAQDEAKNSLTEIQTLEKNTNQEVDKQFKSEVLSSPKKKSYKLSAPEESIELFNNHLLAEKCLTYHNAINRYGSIDNYINDLTNETGDEHGDIKKQLEKSSVDCSIYDNKKEKELLATVDKYLIESAALGNENASLKYASILSQRSIFAKDLYSDKERLDFHRKSIEILSKLSEKGHAESMLFLSELLSDYVNFPETHDVDKSRKLIEMHESLTKEDISKFK